MTTLASPEAGLVQETLAAGFGGTAPVASFTVVASRELTAASGRRRVVSYLVDRRVPRGRIQVIAKTFSEPHRARLLWEHLQALSAGPFAAGRFRVPQVLGFNADAGLVLLQGCPGTSLDELGPLDRRDGAREAARWLARLHTSEVELPRSFDVAQETLSAHEWAEIVGDHRPDQRQEAHRLARLWAGDQGGGAGPAPGRPPIHVGGHVPLHKDFHAGHVLLDRTGPGPATVFVIDLDEARQGDAGFDLGHFCAYLQLSGDDEAHSRDAFLDEYARLTGWHDNGFLAGYEAYTWLKIAKQLALRSGPCRSGTAATRWTVGDAVARGLACLAR